MGTSARLEVSLICLGFDGKGFADLVSFSSFRL